MYLSNNRQSEQHVWNKPTVFSLIEASFRESFLIYAPLYIWDIEAQIWLIQFLPPYKLIKEGLKVYHIQKREIYLDLGCNILSNVFNNV